MTDRQPVLANANRVTGFLFVGGAPGSGPTVDPVGEVAELRRLGVTDILDCRAEATPAAREVAQSAGIGYATAPQEDGLDEPEEGWFDTGLTHARAVLSDPDRVLFTHCQGGRGRGPSMGFAVLLESGMAPAEAFAAIKAVRPQSLLSFATHALDHHLAERGITGAAAAELRAELAREIARWP
ncbi:MAG: hypothetical protein WCF04_15630 [Candidatus Nanopelagicales bacterium]